MFSLTLERIAQLLSQIDHGEAFLASLAAEIQAGTNAEAVFLLGGAPGAVAVLASCPAGTPLPAATLAQAVGAVGPTVFADGTAIAVPLMAGAARTGVLVVTGVAAARAVAQPSLGQVLGQVLRLALLRQEQIEETTWNRRLQEQLREAQKAEAVVRLTASVAHDLRDIQHVTLGYSELLLDNPDMPADERQLFAEEILRATEHGSALTRQLLDASRPDDRGTRPLALDDLVRSLAKTLRHLLGESIELRLNLSPAGGLPLVDADPVQLQQALMGLCSNCRDALPEGGQVTIRVHGYHLAADEDTGILPAAPGDYVCVEVEDNGTGIAPEVQGLVFEPFFSTRPDGQASGLGLAMVCAIARQYHGFLRLHSAVGEGTRMSVFLPACQTVPEETVRERQQSGRDQRQARIFLAEDNRQLRTLLVHQLESAHYVLETARDGDEACEKLDHLKQAPDLFLLDVAMPGRNGREVYEHACARGMRRPVLFCTGHGDQHLPAAYVESLGNARLLAKPCSVAVLVDAIEHLLDQAED